MEEIRITKIKVFGFQDQNFEIEIDDRAYLVTKGVHNSDVDILFYMLSLYSDKKEVLDIVRETFVVHIELRGESTYLVNLVFTKERVIEHLKINNETVVLKDNGSLSRLPEEILEHFSLMTCIRGVVDIDQISDDRETILNECIGQNLLITDYKKTLLSNLNYLGYELLDINIFNHDVVFTHKYSNHATNFYDIDLDLLTSIKIINRLVTRRYNDVGDNYLVILSGVSSVPPRVFIKYSRLLHAYNCRTITVVEEPMCEFTPDDCSVII